MTLIFIYITNPNKAEAKKIARHLLEKKLIACANIYGNVNSMYPWKGRIADEIECILIAKTDRRNYGKIVKEIERIHSYTVPCVAKIPVKTNKKYGKWVRSCLNK